MENKYLLILFYSAGGSVRNIAHAIADGAEQENLSVKVRTVPKISSVAEQTEESIPKKDDTLMSKDGTVGKTAFLTKNNNCILLSSLASITPDKSKIEPKFL